ncbi:uncharacterized protein G2W53_001635 [Senna tora]|uniref:Uncharacterized protein n=1 Tax=Senna tora TaxID=362788 RepID=A0A834XHW6_9FABA|nr:uncharacterized protein G2W53_001635 [Senna tora]
MNNSEADSLGNVLFSWEKKGGVSKLSESDEELRGNYNLPPPPCSVEGSNYKNKISGSGQDLQIIRRGCGCKADDPFLAAYKQCTKSSKSKVVVAVRLFKLSELTLEFGFAETPGNK